MSLSVHWTRQVMARRWGDGWLARTAEQWTQESGLSPKEQATVRARLRDAGLIEERRIGQPARLEHRVVWTVLRERLRTTGRETRLSAAQGRQPTAPICDWWDSSAMAELLGAPIAFHRSLAGTCGGVNAALLMSCVLHRMRGQLQRGRSSWVHGEAARWQSDLGLSRREQEAARAQLSRRGLWEERLVGSPPRMLMRVRVEALAALLRMPVVISTEPIGEASRDNALTRTLSTPHVTAAGFNETANQGCGVPTSLICRNRQICSAETAKLDKGICIHGCYRLLSPQRARDGKLSTDGRTLLALQSALIVPEALSPSERALALSVVADLEPDTAQSVLDEFSGRLSAPCPPRSPIAYLRALANRARAGSFVPDLAVRVAQQRDPRKGSEYQQGLGRKMVGSGSKLCSGTSSDEPSPAPTLLKDPGGEVSAVQLHREKSLRQLRELSQRLRAQRSGLAPASTHHTKEQT